jgi:peptidoglycan L-alanyl-D-glutamate endopeptidase CwlK
MDKASELHLLKVHPDLIKVIKTSKQTPQAFIVVYGIRTLEAEKQAVATGHSTTMHSRHLPNKDGLACAVDVAAMNDGHIDWAKGKEQQIYGQIWAQIKEAADNLGIPVEWGGDWQTFKDWGHIQLPWKDYP